MLGLYSGGDERCTRGRSVYHRGVATPRRMAIPIFCYEPPNDVVSLHHPFAWLYGLGDYLRKTAPPHVELFQELS